MILEDLASRRPVAGKLQDRSLVEIIGVPTGIQEYIYVTLLQSLLRSRNHLSYNTYPHHICKIAQRHRMTFGDSFAHRWLQESCRIFNKNPKRTKRIFLSLFSSSLSENLSQFTRPKKCGGHHAGERVLSGPTTRLDELARI
jgi:hypothetical protein